MKGSGGHKVGTAGVSPMAFMRDMAANPLKQRPDPIPMEEIALHDTEDDCWIVLRGKVYDVTKYLKHHPGGKSIILSMAGKDCSQQFYGIHPWVNAEALIGPLCIGTALPASQARLSP
eukprot:GHVO01012723.1.p1 GENE.GHVO01012723.1~~GHVO01012723.1.p1  ORF type:complete len:118 (+),score=18.79 GHVO01012723.1:35-388(+)